MDLIALRNPNAADEIRFLDCIQAFGANALRSLCGARLARFLELAPGLRTVRESCAYAAAPPQRRRPDSFAVFRVDCAEGGAQLSCRQGKGSLLTARAARLLPMKRTLKITSKGQVTLRREVLDQLGARPGERIVVEPVAPGRVEIRRAESGGKSQGVRELPQDGGRADLLD